MKKLLILKADYADEFEFTTYRIMDINEYDEWKRLYAEFANEIGIDTEVEIQIGTNENLVYTLREYLNMIIVKDIDDNVAQILIDTLGTSFGIPESISLDPNDIEEA